MIPLTENIAPGIVMEIAILPVNVKRILGIVAVPTIPITAVTALTVAMVYAIVAKLRVPAHLIVQLVLIFRFPSTQLQVL